MSFYRTLQSLRIHNRKGVAVLIDPDKVHDESRMKAMAELLRHTDVAAFSLEVVYSPWITFTNA